MPFPTPKLKVYPNPWVYIDHNGCPAGRLPPDGYEDSPSAGAIGATMVDVKELAKPMVMRVANRDMEVNPAQHYARIQYSSDAVSIPNTAYYRDAVSRGDLVAADATTASLCGLKFVDPKKVLADAKSAAVTRFDAETDTDAYKRFGSVEPLYTPSALAPAVTAAADPVKADK